MSAHAHPVPPAIDFSTFPDSDGRPMAENEEYYIFDPAGGLSPPFRAYRRLGDRLEPVALLPSGGIYSLCIGYELRPVDGWLRVIDPETDRPFPTPDDERRGRFAAEERAEQAEERARRAEEQVRHEEEARRAAEERAKQAEARAQQAEERARRAAAALIADLEARLRAAGQGGSGREGEVG